MFAANVALMPRLNIFAKGNADLRNALHVLQEDGAVTWNGINDVLRARKPGWTARVIHETLTRSDALLENPATPPPSLVDRDLPLGPFPVAAQFQSALFTGTPDVVILSIQPDVMNAMVRHRGDGHLFFPHDAESWSDADRNWLATTYAPERSLTPALSMANLERIVARLRLAGDPHILVFNLSPVVPWERVHCYQGLGETLAQRIRRFNVALADLSAETGISIVDVDAVIARGGVERLKLDAVALTAEGYRRVCEEVVHILDDLGCFPEHEARA